MTTPDTSAVRAWARSNGYDVADRGRLPAEVTDAYVAAHGKGSTAAPATGKPSARKPAAQKKATTAKKSGSGKTSGRATSTKAGTGKPAAAKPAGRKPAAASTPPADVAANQAPAADAAPDTRTAPEPKPSPVNDDRRLVALGEQLQALTERVAALEATAGKSNGRSGSKSSRFRRSR